MRRAELCPQMGQRVREPAFPEHPPWSTRPGWRCWRCCFTAGTLVTTPRVTHYYPHFTWRNQSSEKLRCLSKVTKPDAEFKATSSDFSQSSFHITGYLRKYTSQVCLLLTTSMTLYPAEGWKSRPVIDFTHGETSSCCERASEKPVPDRSCLGFGWRCQRMSWHSCRGMSLETTWL